VREVYQLVLEALLAGLEAVRAGRFGREVDAAAREVIAAEDGREVLTSVAKRLLIVE
jgi:Xaa-Pro aminopeptidase